MKISHREILTDEQKVTCELTGVCARVGEGRCQLLQSHTLRQERLDLSAKASLV